ncbi:MAG: isochorismate synthase [Rhodococcus sp.]|nr:isochorismate synthase [Rhodococcus sp. (in: high G+C Gram-positive bacteria)]
MTGQANATDDAQTASGSADQPVGFVLSRPSETITGRGVRRFFNNSADAQAAFARGELSALVGALPFDPDGECALFEPEELHSTPAGSVRRDVPAWQLTAEPRYLPDDAAHAERVRDAVAAIGRGELEKVVLSRRAVVTAETDIDPTALLARLIAGDPAGNGYLVELGDPRTGVVNPFLVGSSPEVLIRRRGLHVSCHPLAGSAARGGTPDEDEQIAQRLLASEKDTREHAHVVDYLRAALGPLCRALEVPERPTLASTGQMWHLGTPIVGTLKSADTTAFDVARALHPTPAIGGTPAQASLDYLRNVEPERRFYAGTVGWCDAAGDGEWMVTIRCGEIAADRRTVTAHAGGGIVAGSDPDLEVAETHAKFRTVLTALRG